MKVLLSIRPKYVDEIINGNKKYEFRKNIFKESVEEIFIYSTSPIKKIVGTFKIEDILEDDPNILWKKYNALSGIDREEFFNYFEGKSKGYAIKIGDLKLFTHPVDPKTINPSFIAPQSFGYIHNSNPISVLGEKNV